MASPNDNLFLTVIYIHSIVKIVILNDDIVQTVLGLVSWTEPCSFAIFNKFEVNKNLLQTCHLHTHS